MTIHIVLYVSFIVLSILDYILLCQALKFYDSQDWRRCCQYNLALDFTWCLTDICNISILCLQIFMSAKFSAPAETYKS